MWPHSCSTRPLACSELARMRLTPSSSKRRPNWVGWRRPASSSSSVSWAFLVTAKDTDGLVLEVTPGSSEVVIDFNYAYNASCAYSPRWACPLAPQENWLPVPIPVGEKNYTAS
jgi:Protein of unknown function (DUF1684)